MKVLYLDAASGVAGNMLLGALIDLGVPVDHLEEAFAAAGMPELRLVVVQRDGGNAIFGTHVAIRAGEIPADPEDADEHAHHGHHHAHEAHRAWRSIRRQLEQSPLPAPIRDGALAVFARLAAAEARVHGCAVDDVHFHELGALDAIGDIVGTIAGLTYLGVERVVCSPLPLGRGEIHSRHGLIPLPGPATLFLLENVPVYGVDEAFEFVTPTGAAVVRTVVAQFGQVPPLTVQAIGHGVGSRQRARHANVLRVVLGEARAEPLVAGSESGWHHTDALVELACNLDDMQPELFAALRERLVAVEGVLDVWWSPITMKDGRPGTVVECLAEQGAVDAALTVLFDESTTLGVRTRRCDRVALARQFVRVETELGPITVKLGGAGGTIRNVAPEYREVKAAAQRAGVSVKQVYAAAAAAAHAAGLRVGAPWP